MSMSESSSEDYYQIVDSLLNTNNYKQWEELPEIAHLTFKAILNEMANISQKIAKNSEYTTELAIKIRETNMNMQHLESYNIDRQAPILSRKESGFKKKKNMKSNNKSGQLSAQKSHPKLCYNQNKSYLESNFESKGPYGFHSIKQHQRSLAEGLNETMLEEVKAMAEAIAEHHKYVKYEDFHEIEEKIKKDVKSIEVKVNKDLSKIDQLVKDKIELLEKSMIEVEIKFSKKVREDQEWLFNYIQSNCVTRNQLPNVEPPKKNQRIEKQSYIIQIDNDPPNLNKPTKDSLNKKKSVNKSSSDRSMNRQKTLSNRPKNLKKDKIYSQSHDADIREFKLNAMKEISDCMKSKDVEKLLDTMEKQMGQKYMKLTAKVGSLQKKIESIFNNAVQRLSPGKDTLIRKKSEMLSRQLVTHQRNMKITENPQYDKYHIKEIEKKADNKKMLKSLERGISDLETSFQTKVQRVTETLRNELKTQINQSERKITADLEERQKILCQIVQQNVAQIRNNPALDQNIEDFIQRTNKSINKIAQQMIIARYLHYGEDQCTDLINWETETINSMSQNFVWKQSKPVILVMASGLYKIQSGIYEALDSFQQQKQGNSEEIAFLLVNGSPISSFKMIKDIPKLGNKNSEIGLRARGTIFCEPVLLPAKSQISIRVVNRFYGQAYIQIQKL